MDTLLTIEEVAELTRKPVATLRYWRHCGTGPKSAKLGRTVVYREADVRAWIEEQFAASERESA
jgi:predicted DNA-binding transcriptional regulator AlpA